MIETKRLTLAPPVVGDFEEVWAMHQEPAVAKLLSQVMGANGPDDAWRKLLRHIGHWSAFGMGVFVVRTREGGDFVGEVGFGSFRRGLGEAFDTVPEAGWILAPRWQGQGLASEAAVAAHDWLMARAPERTVCLIAPENVVSLHVAAKLGYRAYMRADYKGKQVDLLERIG